MKSFQTFSIALLLLFFSVKIWANDGAYFASGNQLIPIFETDISVKKEILKLKKVENDYIEVSVYYEFFNPGKEKEIVVGFEAMPPEGDVEYFVKDGKHPYIYDFTVNLNSENLPFKVAYVADSLYADKGKMETVRLEKFKEFGLGYFYVYHFNAKFKQGLNVIQHTYCYKLSGSVDYHYDFEYILSAASRWKDGKIEDFTLILDLGSYETFSIKKGFFQNAGEWEVEGAYKTENISKNGGFIDSDALKFHSRTGKLSFKKINFEPKNELFVYAVNCHNCSVESEYLPFSMYQQMWIREPQNHLERKILRNLPYARRGLVFKSPELNNFFRKMDWYMPDGNFSAENAFLTKPEEEWVKKWK